MSRVFLMKWYHFSVEYFEDLRNVNHCEFLIMRKNESGKYILQNKLRTWTELKRERAVKEKAEKADKGDKGDEDAAGKEKENGNSKDSSKLSRALSQTTVTTTTNTPPIENRRRWGGCPNGCDHDKRFKIRQTLADLVKSDSIISNGSATAGPVAKLGTGSENGSGSSSNGTVTNGTSVGSPAHGIANPAFNGTADSHTAVASSQGGTSTIISRRPVAKRFQSNSGEEGGVPELTVTGGPEIDVAKAHEDVVSSPDGTPSFISLEDRLRSHTKSPLDRLHVGRDFGGTYSGHNSVVASDADSSEDDEHRRRMARVLNLKESNGAGPATNGTNGAGEGGKNGLVPLPQHSRPGVRDQSRVRRGIKANRLGDHPHSSEGEHEAECEHDHDHCYDHEHDHDHEHDGDEEEEEEEEGEGEELSRTLTDEADEALLRRAEKEDRSVRGSVY